MDYNILVAEDDRDIVEILRLYLENEGLHVIEAQDGVDALELMEKTEIHLAVVDIMMPRMDGYSLIRRIRETSSLPIIILSAKNEDSDKILGLNIGADDYLPKPFNPLEVIARVNANLRRCYDFAAKPEGNSLEKVLKVGDLVLDTGTFTLCKKERDIVLTLTEYKILSLLMSQPGRIFTKAQIYEKINGEYFQNDDNTLMVHISRIREKIERDTREPRYIKTVRGLGYKIEKI